MLYVEKEKSLLIRKNVINTQGEIHKINIIILTWAISPKIYLRLSIPLKSVVYIVCVCVWEHSLQLIWWAGERRVSVCDWCDVDDGRPLSHPQTQSVTQCRSIKCIWNIIPTLLPLSKNKPSVRDTLRDRSALFHSDPAIYWCRILRMINVILFTAQTSSQLAKCSSTFGFIQDRVVIHRLDMNHADSMNVFLCFM